jgi:hypothetical protein
MLSPHHRSVKALHFPDSVRATATVSDPQAWSMVPVVGELLWQH